MNQSVAKRKCVVLCLLSLAFGAVAALGGTRAEVPGPTRAGAPAVNALTVARDRRALEAYEKRNAEITPRAEYVVPTITDNAALLYYQAFLFRPEPYEAMKHEIWIGTEPTKQIRTYLGRCLPMIEMVETASRIPGCTWGVWPQGEPSWAPLRDQLVKVTEILLVDAGTLAVDGHYRVALERCLTVRRFARHLNDDSELCQFAMGPDILALNTIQDVLSVMPPDVDTLTWFRGQFAVVPGPMLSFAKTLRRRVKVQLDAMRMYPDHLRAFREMAIREAKGQQSKENIRTLSDEQFHLRAYEGLARFTDSILRILDSEATHEQKLARMKELVDEKMEDDATDPVIKGLISGINMKGQINVTYLRQIVEHETRVNGTKIAVEVYLVLAKTGRLPEKLPEHLPKDPLTGRDFVYEITDEGFALRCQGPEFQTRKKSLLEFRVNK